LYPNGFVKFKWIGTRFILIESSKEKKDIITEINTNYAPTIFERNAELRFTPTADRTVNLTANARFYGCEVLIANDATATYKLVVSFGGVETIDIHFGCQVKFTYNANGWTYEVLTDFERETETICKGTHQGYQKYKKVVDFGALQNGTTVSVAHGISGTFTPVKIHGMAYSTTASFGARVLSQSFGGYCDLRLYGADISVITASDLSTYTSSFITIEYIKTVLP
jgi:hypothetical protein